MSAKSCGNCVFGKTGVAAQMQTKPGELVCFRSPPIASVVPTSQGPAVMSIRPSVKDTDVCAFWWDTDVRGIRLNAAD